MLTGNLHHNNSSKNIFNNVTIINFVQLFILHLAVRELIRGFEFGVVSKIVFGIILMVVLVFSIFKPSLNVIKIALIMGLSMLLYKLYTSFPQNSNHFYIETILCICLLLFLTKKINDERISILNHFILLITVFVLVGSGVQKLLAGTYIDGSFLASQIKFNALFSNFFALIAPNEVERISTQSIETPFYFKNKMLILLSASIPIVEIIAGGMLVFKKTRFIGVVLGVLTLIGIEIVARELMFGLLFITLITFQLPDRWFTKLVPFYATAYFLMIIAKLIHPELNIN
ncbi:MAG: hypothetical protein R2801_11315 [Chitinophagales bacterium]